MTHIRPSVIKVFDKSYGRTAGAESTVSLGFFVDIPAGVIGVFDLPTVPVGQEFIYQFISLSCDDDTAIHRMVMASSGTSFVYSDFLINGQFDFPGRTVPSGGAIEMRITNRSAEELTFRGMVNYVVRSV